MTNDFGITEKNFSTSYDQRWMASNSGLDLGQTQTLDLASIASVRDVNGNIPSGVGVARLPSKLYGLFVAGATDATGTLAGFIGADINIVDSKGAVQASGKAPFSLLTRVDIKPAFLPVVAQRTITAATPTTAQLVFVS